MEIDLILATSFAALVGLKLCTLDKPNDKYLAQTLERFWTTNPYLRIIYGITNIIGVLFVLGSIGYLTFAEHWWYLAVYIGELLAAYLIALFIGYLLKPFHLRINEIYARTIVQRIVGILIIFISIVLFLLLL